MNLYSPSIVAGAFLLSLTWVACGTESSSETEGVTDAAIHDTISSDSAGGESDSAVVDSGDGDAEQDVASEDATVGDASSDVVPDTSVDAEDDASADTATCVEGEEVRQTFNCEDGSEVTVSCVCFEGALECGPDPCEAPPTPCRDDGECAAEEYCDACASSSCPACPDCLAGCLEHGCPTQSDTELTCRAPRFDCVEGQVSIIRDGCWLCVDRETCEPPTSTSPCEEAGAECMDECRRGTAEVDLSCEPGGGVCCEETGSLSDCETAGATCYEADRCPEGTESIRSSCEPTGGICCQDVVSDCEASGATCYESDRCPEGTESIRSSCEPSGGICCQDVVSDCEASGALCLAVFDCPGDTVRIRSSCDPTGGVCCQGAPRYCDDGLGLACDVTEPECPDFSIAAIRDGCWECVNPISCHPWGEPGCSERDPCPRGFECNSCATSSCPFCEDCLAACVPVD